MVGSALETIVLDSIATNIARRRPLRASSTSRWVIWPDCSAVHGGMPGWSRQARFGWMSKVAHPQPYARWLTVNRLATQTWITPSRGIGGARKCSDPQAWPSVRGPAPVDVTTGSPAGRVAAVDSPAVLSAGPGCC